MPKMHADEVDIDAALVERLIAAQFPEWAELPVAVVPSWGTDNALYRLGDDMVVRLPRIARAVATLESERHWLPRLAPHLPLAVPVPLAEGAPGGGLPWTWSVYRWLEGEAATPERPGDLDAACNDLAELITAFQRIDVQDGPRPAPDSGARGAPLAPRDEAVRAALASLADTVDADAVLALWADALRAPEWQRPPVWFHGDLDSRNLLAAGGRLTAVLDFGSVGVGDPACDVMVAWKLFPAELRGRFRDTLAVDDATWARARGWALSQALIALGYYTLETNPVLVTEARRWLAEVLADPGTIPRGRRPLFP